MENEKIGDHTPRYGTSGYKRRESDFYPTPYWVTELLIDNLEIDNLITNYDGVWEPAVGEGHIQKMLEKRNYHVYGTDLKNGIKENFFQYDYMFAGTSHIITNPPYSLAYEFVEHSIKLVSKTNGIVCMLLNNNWDAAKGNSKLTSLNSFYKKLVITKRIRWIEGSIGSPRENHAWYIWDLSHNGLSYIEYWR